MTRCSGWHAAEGKKNSKEKPSWWKCPCGFGTSHLPISQLPKCWFKPICLQKAQKEVLLCHFGEARVLSSDCLMPGQPSLPDNKVLWGGRCKRQVNLGLMISRASAGELWLPSKITVPCPSKGTLYDLVSHFHHIRPLSFLFSRSDVKSIKVKALSGKLTAVQVQTFSLMNSWGCYWEMFHFTYRLRQMETLSNKHKVWGFPVKSRLINKIIAKHNLNQTEITYQQNPLAELAHLSMLCGVYSINAILMLTVHWEIFQAAIWRPKYTLLPSTILQWKKQTQDLEAWHHKRKHSN